MELQFNTKDSSICPKCFLIVRLVVGKVEDHPCIDMPMSQTLDRLDQKLKPQSSLSNYAVRKAGKRLYSMKEHMIVPMHPCPYPGCNGTINRKGMLCTAHPLHEVVDYNTAMANLLRILISLNGEDPSSPDFYLHTQELVLATKKLHEERDRLGRARALKEDVPRPASL